MTVSVLMGEGQNVYALTKAGKNAYVLCGSTLLSKGVADQFTGCDAAIEITDIPSFGMAISNQLAGYRGGLNGGCIYGDRTIQRRMQGPPIALPTPGGSMPMEHLTEAVQEATQQQNYFLKHIRHAQQCEHRMLWMVDRDVAGHIDIHAPEARQFCRRIPSHMLPATA